MLRQDASDYVYYVFPSWAEMPYAWHDLPQLISDPFSSPHINDNTKRSLSKLFETPEATHATCRMIDGPCGGGIIEVPLIRQKSWWPNLILIQWADVVFDESQRYLANHATSLPFRVFFLEHHDGGAAEIGISPPKRTFPCGTSAENIESDVSQIFWCVGYQRGARKTNLITNELPLWANYFGFTVDLVDHLPANVREEVRPWFVSDEYEYRWFTVRSADERAGYNYAVVRYFALHLRFAVGPRMKWFHLIANIENSPNVRQTWLRK